MILTHPLSLMKVINTVLESYTHTHLPAALKQHCNSVTRCMYMYVHTLEHLLHSLDTDASIPHGPDPHPVTNKGI